MHIDHYKPIVSFKKKNEEGIQHLIDGENNMKYPCFRCERWKPDFGGARHSGFDKKTNNSEVNTPEIVQAKFKELKDSFRCHRRTNSGSDVIYGSNHVIDGEVVPNWDGALQDKDSHNRNLMAEWNFSQEVVLNKIPIRQQQDGDCTWFFKT